MEGTKMNSIHMQNYHSRILVDLWTDFIDWDKRRKGENGFLKKTLKRYSCHRIFESCLGDGCDSIHLIKEGFDVVSNDLDLLFIKKAQENARKEKVKLKITSFDWRQLSKHFSSNSFDAVLCLGNSLTYLFSKRDQLKTLKQFKEILKPNGILIIDERNYQYFLDEREKILKEDFRYSNKFVYCGKKVHGYPIEITNKKIVMEYTDLVRGKKCRLILYPFKENELLGLLKESGFTGIKQFSDFKPGKNKKADFYTYVAK